ncbi:hypothetical protein Taro_050281 [Colocasia esculenta]|uniref:Non-lysosomal glucosylceramidase n=1 Tax=Colocasia esculenta TaxID=4460 RepID=A0A843XD06_COLES|nr:hypothetical protein [Colocasia esculenta]
MVSGQLFHCRKQSWPPDEYVSKTALQLLNFDGGAPPEQAWRRRLNSHANLLKEFSVTFMEAVRMMRLGVRLWSYVREEASHGRKAPIDPFRKEKCRPSASQGVSLGGMGSGSISRGFRGEFKHWQIIPNSCETSPIMADQFSIFISRDASHKKYSSVLAPGQHEGLEQFGDEGISSWGWNLSGQHSTYHALFPRAWTIYDGIATVNQILNSKFHVGKYHHLFLIIIEKAVFPLQCLFTLYVASDGVSGVLLHHKTAKDNPPVTFAIAACETQNVNVTVLPSFGLSAGSCVTARDMWGTMVQSGQFDQENFDCGPSMPSLPGETLCAAVSASTWVEPHGKCTVAFAVAWASPQVKFQKGCTYNRRYTKFYGTSERSAADIAHDALMGYKWWEEEIEKWQNPILKDEKLPEWYKFTLFNELYFLVAGGTLWTDGESPSTYDRSDKSTSGSKHHRSTKNARKDTGNSMRSKSSRRGVEQAITANGSTQDGACDDLGIPRSISSFELAGSVKESGPNAWCFDSPADEGENVGRFLYLEGVEYVMWCTYDVHFYASFALLDLFPKIELSIQRDFAKAVLCEDKRKVKFLAGGGTGIRKVKGAVPHDLGMHDPWHEMNAYNIHDTSRWKDLNPKFVLQVYRDFAATGDMSFGRQVWPAVKAAMEFMEQFDRDGDGLIENDGFPDQTYDTWTVHGISAYCGCLWLASLQAAATMAYRLGEHSFAEKCKSTFLKAKSTFEAKLWNGSYFNYDSGTSGNSRSIQADQLAGQWYTASSGLPPLFDDAKIKSTLQKIYDFNVMKVKGGRMGAVNGMNPNGKVDECCMQSREIWTGVTYAVAANMLLAGMDDQAFTTAKGIFTTGWSEEGFGYWFQTPEGWTVDGHYRSLIYMRPLAIWAMQWALSPPKAILDAPKISMVDRIYTSPFDLRNQNETGVRKIGRKNSTCFGRSVFHCEC